MGLDLTNAISQFKQGIEMRKYKDQDGKEYVGCSRDENSMNNDSCIRISNTIKSEEDHPFTSSTSQNDLSLFFGSNGINWDNNGTQSTDADGDIVYKDNNGNILYEYCEQDGEAFRTNYDTNGDGVIDNNDDKDHPIYNKVGKNDNNETVIFETKYSAKYGEYITYMYNPKASS